MVDQVGGTHYRSVYQHWDWVTDIGLPYLPACATKYVVRWRKKNGRQDLMKARSYVEKIISSHNQIDWSMTATSNRFTELFIAVTDVGLVESSVIWLILSNTRESLQKAIIELDTLIVSTTDDSEVAATRRNYSGVDHSAPFGYDGNG